MSENCKPEKFGYTSDEHISWDFSDTTSEMGTADVTSDGDTSETWIVALTLFQPAERKVTPSLFHEIDECGPPRGVMSQVHQGVHQGAPGGTRGRSIKTSLTSPILSQIAKQILSTLSLPNQLTIPTILTSSTPPALPSLLLKGCAFWRMRIQNARNNGS